MIIHTLNGLNTNRKNVNRHIRRILPRQNSNSIIRVSDSKNIPNSTNLILKGFHFNQHKYESSVSDASSERSISESCQYSSSNDDIIQMRHTLSINNIVRDADKDDNIKTETHISQLSVQQKQQHNLQTRYNSNHANTIQGSHYFQTRQNHSDRVSYSSDTTSNMPKVKHAAKASLLKIKSNDNTRNGTAGAKMENSDDSKKEDIQINISSQSFNQTIRRKRRNLSVKDEPKRLATDLLSSLPMIDDDESKLRKRLDEFNINMEGSEIIKRVKEISLDDPGTDLWSHTYLPGNRVPHPPQPPSLLQEVNGNSYIRGKATHLSSKHSKLLPQTPSVYLNTENDAHSPDLRQFCLSQPVAIIRNLASTLNLNLGLFSTKMLVAANPNHKIEQRIQDLQAPDENKDPAGKTSLRCYSTKCITTIRDYANYQARTFVEAIKERKLEVNVSVPTVLPNDERNQAEPNGDTEEIKLNNFNFNDLKKKKRKIYFGTNCDLSDESKWSVQLQELKKLPNFLKVVCSDNLLSHCGFTIMGMNSVQLYMKVPGCRTPGHQENNNFCSININIGPGDCEWFSVTEQYWGAINALCEEHKIDYLSGSWWPNLEDLRQRQIPVYRFIQRPGELVWINSGTVHWVQSIGWCNNVAWNVGPFVARQYSLALERYEYNKMRVYKSIVPMIHLSWQLASNIKIVDHQLYQLIKYTIMVSIIHCTLTWNFLERAKVPIVYQPREENESTQYCEDCEHEVFNIFLIKPIKHGIATKKSSRNETYEVRCLNCALKISENLTSFKSLYQYRLQELEDMYDSFKVYSTE